MGSHPVKWTAHARRPTVEDMGINHGRFDVALAQQFLNGSDIRADFEHMRRKKLASYFSGNFSSRSHGTSVHKKKATSMKGILEQEAKFVKD